MIPRAKARRMSPTDAVEPRRPSELGALQKPRLPGLSEERTMGLEPTTLSLGSLSTAAWLDANRRDTRNQYRWEPLEPGDHWRATGARFRHRSTSPRA